MQQHLKLSMTTPSGDDIPRIIEIYKTDGALIAIVGMKHSRCGIRNCAISSGFIEASIEVDALLPVTYYVLDPDAPIGAWWLTSDKFVHVRSRDEISIPKDAECLFDLSRTSPTAYRDRFFAPGTAAYFSVLPSHFCETFISTFALVPHAPSIERMMKFMRKDVGIGTQLLRKDLQLMAQEALSTDATLSPKEHQIYDILARPSILTNDDDLEEIDEILGEIRSEAWEKRRSSHSK